MWILGLKGIGRRPEDNIKKSHPRRELNYLQKPWTKILLVINVGSLEKRSNQPRYLEPKTRSPKLLRSCSDQRVLFYVNPKKADMASRNIVMTKHVLISFAVVFGFLVFGPRRGSIFHTTFQISNILQTSLPLQCFHKRLKKEKLRQFKTKLFW